MTIQTIRGRDGSVLHEGSAPSKREFVESLVRRKRSLAGADLHKFDLSYIDITDADFAGADLTDANLKGSRGERPVFDGAVLHGTRAEGMSAKRASFAGSSIAPSAHGDPLFAGAVLTYANFDGVRMESADLKGAGLTGSSWVGSRVCGTSFVDAWFANADHTDAEYYDNDFSGARMMARASTHRIPSASLPDRTRGTRAVGNVYAGTLLDRTLGAFSADRTLGRVERGVCWSVSTAAVLAATGFVDDVAAQETWRQAIGQVLGSGLALVLVGSAAAMAVERLNDAAKDVIDRSLGAVQRFVRQEAGRLMAGGARLADHAVAVLFGPGRRFVEHAIMAESNGAPSALADVRRERIGRCVVVLARRDAVARCLETLGACANGRDPGGIEHLVVRADAGHDDAAPSAVKHHVDGGMTAYWAGERGEVRGYVAFDALGRQVARRGDVRIPARRGETRRLFEDALLASIGAPPDFRYPFDTHEILAGVDGSVVAVESGRSLPANVDDNYVVIQKDGTAHRASAAVALARLEIEEMRGPEREALAPGFLR